MAEKEERVYHSEKEPKVQAIAYSQAFDNAGYYSTSSLKKAGNYNLGELWSFTSTRSLLLLVMAIYKV